MRLYVVRHAKAVDRGGEGPDGMRHLTREGRDAFRKNVAEARRAGMEPEAILASPLVRALQTAEILAAELPFAGEVLPSALLAAGPSPDRLVDLLAPVRRCRSVAVVGHDPWLTGLCRSLLPLGDDFLVKKGDILAVDLEPGGEGRSAVLRWRVTKGRLVLPGK